jgi:hypothetical protein
MFEDLLADNKAKKSIERCEHCDKYSQFDDPVREYDDLLCYPIGEYNYLHDSCKFELDQEFKNLNDNVEFDD